MVVVRNGWMMRLWVNHQTYVGSSRRSLIEKVMYPLIIFTWKGEKKRALHYLSAWSLFCSFLAPLTSTSMNLGRLKRSEKKRAGQMYIMERFNVEYSAMNFLYLIGLHTAMYLKRKQFSSVTKNIFLEPTIGQREGLLTIFDWQMKTRWRWSCATNKMVTIFYQPNKIVWH